MNNMNNTHLLLHINIVALMQVSEDRLCQQVVIAVR